MTEQSFVYLDAVPERVSVNESYTYEFYLRTNPDTVLVQGPQDPDRPSGLVQVDFPYDGYTSLPTEVAERLQARHASAGHLAGQVGWLAISKPLDVESGWLPQPGLEEIRSVRLPLIEPGLVGPDDWVSDGQCAIAQHAYAPETPRYFPLEIEMRVFDSAEYWRQSTQNNKEMVKNAKSAEEILAQLNGSALQGGQLVIDLELNARIPSALARQKEEVKVTLQELGLRWPTIPALWQLTILDLWKIGTEDEEIHWRYNPDLGTVEVRELKAVPLDEPPGSTLRPYNIHLRLLLHSPGKVVSEDELEGWAQVRLDGCLLSSRRVAWLGPHGLRMPRRGGELRAPDNLIQLQTRLKAHFKATLSDQFKRRPSEVYRQWYFYGLKFSAARLDDMAATLRDLGFRTMDEPPTLLERGAKPNLIGLAVGRKTDVHMAGQPALLRLELWAIPVAPASTRCEREIPDGGTVSTEVDTTDLILQARGYVEGGPGSLLAQEVDKVMTDLKNRFTAIADLR